MSGVPNLQLQAMMGEMQKLIKAEFEVVHKKLNRVQEKAQQVQPRNLPHRREITQPRYARTDFKGAEVGSYSHGGQSSMESPWRPHYTREARDRFDDNLKNSKLKIPTFHGKTDPEAYLEWEKKTELVFACQKYSEFMKVRVAATEFCDYAITWWDLLVTSRRRNREYPIETWAEMKAVMRKRFMPSHYNQEQQLMGRSSTRQTYWSYSSSMKPSYSKEKKTAPKPRAETKPSPEEIRAVVLRNSGEFETETEEETLSTSPQDQHGEAFAAKEELLAVKRSLNEQGQIQENEQEKELFHSSCSIPDKLCSLMIDDWSCRNAASTPMEEKMGLQSEVRDFTRSYEVLPHGQQNGIIYSILIKEKPPESLQDFLTKRCTVSRSKLFQEEGYDVIMRTGDVAIKPETKPKFNQTGGTSINRPEKDICAFNGAFHANPKESSNKSTCSRNLTHQRFTRKWKQVHRSSDLLGIKVTKPVITEDLVTKAETDLRPLFESFQDNHDDFEHETNWRGFSDHQERFSKLIHPNQSSDEGVTQLTNWMNPGYSAMEADTDMCSLFEALRLNHKVLRCQTTWVKFLSQSGNSSKWNQPDWSPEEEVIHIANRVFLNLPDLDLRILIGGFRHNQEELGYKTTWARESTNQRYMVNWIHAKIHYGLEDMHFLIQKSFNLAYLEYHGLSQLQTYLWRPGEFIIRMVMIAIKSSLFLIASKPKKSPK